MSENDSKESEDDFLKTAKKRAARSYQAWDVNFADMEDDVRMLAGDQWDSDTKQKRDDDERPYLTFNKLAPIVDQIVGEQRQMRPSISVFPAQGDVRGADIKVQNRAGSKDYSLAECYEGIIRNIEYNSNADIAYDTAFEHCSGWGLGYILLRTDYADLSFDQDFKIERVRNYRSVLLDPDFQNPDGSDCKFGFLFTKIHKDEYARRYPNADPVSISNVDADAFELWADGDYVFLAEYYYLKPKLTDLLLMSNGAVLDRSKVDAILDELAARGVTVVKERKATTNCCYWSKISGAGILEPEQETVFRWVPIIPVLGKEIVVDGTPHYRGAIRYAKDAQISYNYSRTSDIERTALLPKVPYILSDAQIKGYKEQWDTANKRNRAYLLYKETNAPKPTREQPVMNNPGEVNQAMLAADDIKATTNMFDPSMGNISGANSGKQELLLQQKGDRGSYAFSDNMVRSIRHLGRILIDAIPKVYDTQRIMRLRFADESEDFVEINKTIIDRQTNQPVIVNDLSVGKFDLVVKVGPSYSTQRMEAVDAITEFVRAVGAGDPVVGKALAMMVAKNSDWPEADKIVEILRRSLPPGLIDPEPGDKPPPQPPPTPPTPADQANIAAAQAKIATADATKMKAQASMMESQVEITAIQQQLANLPDMMRSVVGNALETFFQHYQAANAAMRSGAPPPTPMGPPGS